MTDRSAGGRVQSEAPHHGASTPEGAALDDPTVGAFAIAAGIVDAVSVVSVLLFYALEVGSSGPHVFGPLSDATTAVFDVLALPLILWSTRRLAQRAAAWAFGMVVLVATAVGALNSALLVLGLIDGGISFGLSLVVIALQAGWFLLLGSRAGAATALPRGLLRWALLIGIGMLAGMALVLPASLLPGTSPIAVALWILGGVLGGLGWLSWPGWFVLVGRSLRR